MKKFEAPELEVLNFAAADILTTSSCPDFDDGSDIDAGSTQPTWD